MNLFKKSTSGLQSCKITNKLLNRCLPKWKVKSSTSILDWTCNFLLQLLSLSCHICIPLKRECFKSKRLQNLPKTSARLFGCKYLISFITTPSEIYLSKHRYFFWPHTLFLTGFRPVSDVRYNVMWRFGRWELPDTAYSTEIIWKCSQMF